MDERSRRTVRAINHAGIHQSMRERVCPVCFSSDIDSGSKKCFKCGCKFSHSVPEPCPYCMGLG